MTDITFKVNYDGTVTVTNVVKKDSKVKKTKLKQMVQQMTTDKDDDLPRKVTFSKSKYCWKRN